MTNSRITDTRRPFDRTPLLIGIVIIPLAASCAFGLGVWNFTRLQDTRDLQRQPEIRLLVSDRERRDEASVAFARQAGDEQPQRLTLHSPPPFTCEFPIPVDASARRITILPVSKGSGPPITGDKMAATPSRGPPEA